MALKAIITLDNGISLPEAHVVIMACNVSYKLPMSVRIVVNVYKDLYAYELGKPEVIQMTYSCSNDDFNTYFSETILSATGVTNLTQVYQYLETFPQFSKYGDEVIS